MRRAVSRASTLAWYLPEVTTSSRAAVLSNLSCGTLNLADDGDSQPCTTGRSSSLHTLHLPFSIQHARWASISTSHQQQLPQQQPAELTPEPEFFPLPEGSVEAVSVIGQACDAVDKASIASAKAEAWFTAAWLINGIQVAHDSWGLPWWGAIATVNILARLVTFPLVIMSQKSTAKLVTYNHDLLQAKKLQEAYTKAKTQQEQQRLFNEFQQEYKTVSARHGNVGLTTLKVFGVMAVNGITFLSIFGGVSRLMESKAPSLITGGALWFEDLTVSDPYYGLPILCCLSTLLMVEFGMSITGDQMTTPEKAKQAQVLKWVFRGFSGLFLLFGGWVPSGVGCLWVSNAAFAVVQGIALRNARFRHLMGLPSMEEMRAMNADVVASTAKAAARPPPPGTPAAAQFSGVPVDPDTGIPQLFTAPPHARK